MNYQNWDGLASSRRDFLRAAAMAGAASMLPMRGLLAQNPASGGKRIRIDVHHHTAPPAWAKVVPFAARWHWTPEVSLEQMEKFGIQTAITSITQPGVWFSDLEHARTMARECNEFGANMVRDYPGRFGLFAALPMPDADNTLKEIEYSMDTLKADGVGLLTSYGDKWLGDAAFVPVFEELNRRNAIAFVHVTGPSCCQHLVPGSTATMMEYDFDTARTVVSLLVNGTLSRFPNVRLIFVHSGGTLPVLSHRIADRFPKDRADRVPNGVMYELKKLYYEVAHATYPEPLSALAKFVPVSQILFGTDYPAEAIATTTGPLAESGLSAADLFAIDRGNAERLLPRLKS